MPVRPSSSGRLSLGIVLAGAVLLFACDFFHLIDFHEQDAADLRFRLRGEKRAHPDIVLVEIDDSSVHAIGQWPWPRGIHAVLLDVLERYKPRLIFFDVLFTESSVDPAEDEKLKFAIEKSARTLIPFYYYSERPFRAFFPIPPLRDAASGIGFVNLQPDPDGVIRSMRAYLETEEGKFYHPAFMTMRLLMDDPEKYEQWMKKAPVSAQGLFWINYPGSIESFKRVSFNDVIDAVGTERDEKMRDLFQDRIVLVGHTATGTTDLKPTPFSPAEAGVAVQASALHTALTGSFLSPANAVIRFLILLFMTAFTAGITLIFQPPWALLYAGGLAVIYALVNYSLFILAGYVLPLNLPLLASGISYVVVLFMKYLEVRFQGEMLSRELQTAARIQQTFLTQKPPDLPGVDLAFQCLFAKHVGGDFYDWVDLGSKQLGICVGDVSGKGIPAALYMAKGISGFRSEDKVAAGPGGVCTLLNAFLTQGESSGMFLTFIYGVIKLKEKKFLFSNAGHEPLICYRSATQEAGILKAVGGRPLGLFADSAYDELELSLGEGDALLLFSDGVRELRNPKGEEYGLERLCEGFKQTAKKCLTADQIIAQLYKDMTSYQRGYPAHDDRTLLCVRILSS